MQCSRLGKVRTKVSLYNEKVHVLQCVEILLNIITNIQAPNACDGVTQSLSLTYMNDRRPVSPKYISWQIYSYELLQIITTIRS